jgi:hypothetical protein
MVPTNLPILLEISKIRPLSKSKLSSADQVYALAAFLALQKLSQKFSKI